MLTVTRFALAIILLIQFGEIAFKRDFTKETMIFLDSFCILMGIIGGLSAIYYFFIL